MFNGWKIKKIKKKLKVMQANRVNNQPADEEIKKEVALYNELANIYQQMIGSKKFPYAQLTQEEVLRLAADLEDAEANFKLGNLLLNRAKFRESLQQEDILANEINLKKATTLFKEAHTYINAASNLGHIKAKRLKGLALINGWGQEVDKKAGFEFIVESIEQEEAWERVPQIFAEIGLNKPEFFSAIMQRKKTS